MGSARAGWIASKPQHKPNATTSRPRGEPGSGSRRHVSRLESAPARARRPRAERRPAEATAFAATVAPLGSRRHRRRFGRRGVACRGTLGLRPDLEQHAHGNVAAGTRQRRRVPLHRPRSQRGPPLRNGPLRWWVLRWAGGFRRETACPTLYDAAPTFASAGRMFWFTRKKFPGSYFALMAASRS